MLSAGGVAGNLTNTLRGYIVENNAEKDQANP
jgi:hypothetical protein